MEAFHLQSCILRRCSDLEDNVFSFLSEGEGLRNLLLIIIKFRVFVCVCLTLQLYGYDSTHVVRSFLNEFNSYSDNMETI